MCHKCVDCIYSHNKKIQGVSIKYCSFKKDKIDINASTCKNAIIKKESQLKLIAKNQDIIENYKKLESEKIKKYNEYRRKMVKQVNSYCTLYNLTCEFTDVYIIIQDTYDKWCLNINNELEQVELYHKNTKRELNGYHFQNKYYRLNTIDRLFKYINNHRNVSYNRTLIM